LGHIPKGAILDFTWVFDACARLQILSAPPLSQVFVEEAVASGIEKLKMQARAAVGDVPFAAMFPDDIFDCPRAEPLSLLRGAQRPSYRAHPLLHVQAANLIFHSVRVLRMVPCGGHRPSMATSL